MYKKDIVHLNDGAVVEFQEYGDPTGTAGVILPRLAEFAHDGATCGRTSARARSSHYFAGSARHLRLEYAI